MLLRLSKNAFVRQYGPFTYILSRISAYDEMFTDANVFMRWLTRTPMSVPEILGNICKIYSETDQRVIAQDFNEFIAPLIKEKVVIAGETLEEIDEREDSFSYEVENPRTMDKRLIKPEDMQGPSAIAVKRCA